MIQVLHFSLAVFSFPDVRYPRFKKIYSITVYLVSFLLLVYFLKESHNAGKVFQFAGHYWDFDADHASKIISPFFILLIFFIFVAGVWRAVVNRGIERWAVLLMGSVMFVSLVIPGITNMLSRDGLLDRGTYQLTQNISSMVGVFIAVIIFMNTTKDRSSFMSKILIVTVTTLLVMVQGFTYYSLQDQEKSFDLLLKSETHLSIRTDTYPPDMKYMLSYSPKDGAVASIYTKDNIPLTMNYSEIDHELYNTLIYEKIKKIDGKNFKAELEKLLTDSDRFFEGYKSAIIEFANSINPDEKYPVEKILAYIDSIERPVLFTRNKIVQLPEQDFTKHLKAFLPGANTKIFNKVILKYLENEKSDQKLLKHDILTYLTPMRNSGVRIYRKDSDEKNHYVSVMEADSVNNRVIEAGYPYLNYRNYVHGTSGKYIILLLIMVSIIIIGFPFFFWGSLVKPIRNLLSGLKEMQQGNLRVQIPVKVEDEFGYMSRNFNIMADKISEATENLEDKVRARTEELQAAMEELEAMNDQLVEARDALWGEMELAKKIQTRLLPVDPAIADYDISVHMEPADEVGGDYYDIINAAGIDWIVIGDVSGHGVPAGLVMMMTQTAIHVVLAQNPDIAPDKLLDVVNSTIAENIRRLGEDKYMTISVLAATNGGRFMFSGLHQDIMIYRTDTGKIDLIETRGMWIGIVDDINGMLELDSLSMNPGDVMLLYSDGITEAVKNETVESENPELYGDVRLAEIFRKSALQPVEDIKVAIINDLQNYYCGDDVTMVILKRKM
jgi:serine phosphatase RsbU (regulator of sigma subunit)